jgi:hypothetical protein
MAGTLMATQIPEQKLRSVANLFEGGGIRTKTNILRVMELPSDQHMRSVRAAMRYSGLGELTELRPNIWSFELNAASAALAEPPDVADAYTTASTREVIEHAKRVGARAAVFILF